MCDLNCDIILLKDFLDAFERVRRQMPKFLMVGRRWDTDITQPVDFGSAGWEDEIRKLALTTGLQQIPSFYRLFLFPQGPLSRNSCAEGRTKLLGPLARMESSEYACSSN